MIRQLDEETIKRIAAGEVIERPVSVVKELVENAVDAGADEIQVQIRDGGKSLISVTDNGSGIAKEEIETAFLPHATSKISSFSDLYRLHSLGFRGEALASIVAVADVEAQSKTAEETTGIALRYAEGKLVERKTVAMGTGTRIVVSNLFSHIPVRRTFLKSDVAESNAISRFLYTMAIGHPEIAFRFYRDEKRILQTGKQQTLEETLLVLYGRSYQDAIVPVQGEGKYRLSGVIGNNTYYRANRQMQFLFVNGRAIMADVIRESVESCYRSLIPNGRYPAFQLFLETNPENIDVNIHPNKMTIQFTESDKLQEMIRQTVQEALHRKPSIPGEEEKDLFSTPEESYRRIIEQYAWPTKSVDSAEMLSKKEPLFPQQEERMEKKHTDSTVDENKDSRKETQEFTLSSDESAFLVQEKKRSLFSSDEEDQREQSSFLSSHEEDGLLPAFSALRYLGSLFRVYLLFEERGRDALLIVDQHAAHERVNYERFLKQATAGTIVQQRLLKPIILSLTDEQEAAYSSRHEALIGLGFDLASFGEGRVVLRAVPTLFRSANDAQLLLDLLDMPVDHADEYDLLLDQMAMKACKASVKQGDRLSDAEVASLYDQLSSCRYPLTCPHGRPTVIRREKKDFEKWFMRVK
ncbi:DNA mismatch repair endonuclease MutL [Murdochiella massiliensis]|uniref:DNA mismatch repair endonuclease MutL n=1 Tax=Murdochiella massiliensis TaxID=1673723 RepID=UPI00082A9520|nr:DNA mismatch repair endonuclease MutL [Murdochiella massiliensis]